MPQIRFNWVDIFFVTLLIRIGYIGFKNGILSEIFRSAGLFTAVIVSFSNYTILSQHLTNHARWTGAKPDVLSFLVIFFGILIIFKILGSIVCRRGNNANISGINRAMALILSGARGILLISLIYVLFVNSPFGYLSRSTKERSFSGQYVAHIVPLVYRVGISSYPWKADTPLIKLLEN